jgi:hypothetical protein
LLGWGKCLQCVTRSCQGPWTSSFWYPTLGRL